MIEQPYGESDRALLSGMACYQNYFLWDRDVARGSPPSCRAHVHWNRAVPTPGLMPVPVVMIVSLWGKVDLESLLPFCFLISFLLNKGVFFFGRKSHSPFN